MTFYFLNTCYASPEQYDVYRDNGEICGYIRLRWGSLYAEYPCIDGKVIYSYTFSDNFKGIFDDDNERDQYLTMIAKEFKEACLAGLCADTSEIPVHYEILTDPTQLEAKLK